MFYTLMLELG